MEYINIKNNINQTTNIHKNVFLDIVKLMSSKIVDVKIEGEPEIVIVRKGKNVKISFNFTITKHSDLFTTINLIKKYINETIVNLFDLKPYNILMNYQGRH
jgi:hypothetical protein